MSSSSTVIFGIINDLFEIEPVQLFLTLAVGTIIGILVLKIIFSLLKPK